MILIDYLCPSHGLWESLEPRPAPSESACPECGQASPRAISAAHVGTNWSGSVSRGKSDPVPPGCMDTRPLADGMPLHEFRERQRKADESARVDSMRKKFGVDRKPFVG